MKTAITIWNDRVSPVFDVAGQVLLFDTQGKKLCSEQILNLPDSFASKKVASLVEAEVQVLICGAISRDAYSAATGSGIRVYPFIAGDVREVLLAFLAGRLDEVDFAMPGCACRMAFPGRRNHGRGKRRVTGSVFFCRQQPYDQEV